MKNLFFFLCILMAFSAQSCKKCGTCYIARNGTEVDGTRSPEACDADYDALKQQKQDQLNSWETVYPNDNITYVCEDK